MATMLASGGCASSGSETATATSTSASPYPAGVECTTPPVDEIETASSLSLFVEPNPVKAGSEAILILDSDGLGPDALSGAGVAWQCWNGSSWVATGHQVVRGIGGNPQTIALPPGAVSTIPAVGLPTPNSFPILIPPEPPGTYRIRDTVMNNDSALNGFVIVEVE